MSSKSNVKLATACDICGKIFKTPQSVRIHKHVHSRKPVYNCEFCDRMFAYLKPYKTHLSLEHNTERETNSFNTKDVEKDRVRVPQQFQCLECERMFKTKNNLKIHSGIVHSGSNLKSRAISNFKKKHKQQGDAKLAKLKSRIDHKRGPSKVFKSQICHKTSSEKKDQVSHLKRHKLHKCLFCENTFKTEHDMRKHMKESHQHEMIKHWSCTLCNLSFENEEIYDLHMSKMHNKKEKCDKQMTVEITNTNKEIGSTDECEPIIEIISDNDIKEDKRFICDTCGASFSSRYHLKYHINHKHFDGTLVQHKEQEIVNAKMLDKISGSDKSNTSLNKRILDGFKVDKNKLTFLVDSDSQKKCYVCKVCLTAYVTKASFIEHIQSNASDHDMYLMRKYYGSYIDPNEISSVQSNNFNSLLQSQELSVKKQFQNAKAFENQVKVIDVRSTGTNANQSQNIANTNLINNATYVSANKQSNINDNVDESTIINSIDEADQNDMQPLYTARPLLLEEYMSEGFEGTMSGLDDLPNGPHIDNTGKSKEDNSDIQSNQECDIGKECIDNCFQTSTTHSTPNEAEKIEMSNRCTSYRNGMHCFECDDPNAATQSIDFRSKSFEISHQGHELTDINSSSSDHFSFDTTSCCTQCKTSRQLSNLDQSYLRCCLCHDEFCAKCSGLPEEIYTVLLRSKRECSSGIIWLCDRCKNSLPKLANLVSTLAGFDQYVNGRLTEIEDRISLIRDHWNKNKL